jgi:phosphopantothenoylcysteine decarboxylase / phosphopantothenate---cysteine ligase
MLINLKILLGISGGIAAYKSAELIRLFKKNGADVRVVMTHNATQFITPLTIQALSGNSIHIDLFDAGADNGMDHINLARWADVFIIAPASANIIAKMNHGLADDLLSTLYLAATCPIFIAPAMNQAMWSKAVTQTNLSSLQKQGVLTIGPDQGSQACGETGFGRMTEPTAICQYIIEHYSQDNDKANKPLHNLKIMISAGPTREALDPIRYITNRSSGKMGYAIAEAAIKAGADVTLITGPVSLSAPSHCACIAVESAAEMHEAVLSRAHDHHIYIAAAAVADYSPAQVNACKIKKQADNINLALIKTKDILADLTQLQKHPFTVGFAAETNDLANYALDKLKNKNLDMIAANLVGTAVGGFDSDVNALHVFWNNGDLVLPMSDKNIIAAQLIDLITTRYKSSLQH